MVKRADFLFYVEQLFDLCLAEHKHGARDADSEVYRKEASVIEEGIKILAHSVRRPLSPYHNAGDEMTDKAQ